ncbi:Hypothetical_protein [Hexamita inflata]|uniref:Hypothetical_protein n=1 Tax=Hexamita inflata TaxID=28002 RepID=A0AA86TNR6_9EUKA|nr:Hypothetical protein HINF_LOCUS10665 [Hexamita inflata]
MSVSTLQVQSIFNHFPPYFQKIALELLSDEVIQPVQAKLISLSQTETSSKISTITSLNLHFYRQPTIVTDFHNFRRLFVNPPPAASLASSIPASIHQKRKVGLCLIFAGFLLPTFCLLSNLDTPDLHVEWVDGPQVPVDARALQIWCQSANPLSPNPIAVQNILLNTICSRRSVGSGISFLYFSCQAVQNIWDSIRLCPSDIYQKSVFWLRAVEEAGFQQFLIFILV